jgi:putative membrane protein
MLKLWLSIKVFIKGMIMGAVNVFPVSSGTASLILGVFERFVNSIKALNHKNFKFLHKGQFNEFARRTDFKFLVTIILGLLLGMVLTAIFLKQTLKSYEVYTWSFFIGLIIASVVYVMKRVEKVNVKNIVLLLLGFAVSFVLSIKSNPYSNDNFFYLFLCGIVGATGMVVPGVSGSHLMLLMGNYELIVTEAIPALTKASTFMHGARILLPFVLGPIVSIVSFSHLLSWLMRDYRDGTLAVLAGFMLGSLPVVYPWKEAVGTDYVFDMPPWNSELLIALVMVALGAFSVYMLEVMARHTEKKQAERLQNPPQPKRKHHGKKTK